MTKTQSQLARTLATGVVALVALAGAERVFGTAVAVGTLRANSGDNCKDTCGTCAGNCACNAGGQCKATVRIPHPAGTTNS